MQQWENIESPSAQPHKGESLYTVGFGLVPQGTYNGTKLYSQDPLFNQCIFNKN